MANYLECISIYVIYKLLLSARVSKFWKQQGHKFCIVVSRNHDKNEKQQTRNLVDFW